MIRPVRTCARGAALSLGAMLACALAEPASTQTVEDVRAQLEALGERVERLEDVSAIEKLQRSYGYYVDKMQWRDVADLFAVDGTLEIGGRGVFTGRERVYEYMVTAFGPVGPRDGQMVDHQQFQGIVTVDPGGQTARARFAAFVIGGGGWGDVTYENHYVKRDGVWQIAALHAPFNMYSGYAQGWIDNTVPNTRPESFAPPPDLPPSVIYLTFPNYHVNAYHYPNPVTGRAAPPPDPRAGAMAYGRDGER